MKIHLHINFWEIPHNNISINTFADDTEPIFPVTLKIFNFAGVIYHDFRDFDHFSEMLYLRKVSNPQNCKIK